MVRKSETTHRPPARLYFKDDSGPRGLLYSFAIGPNTLATSAVTDPEAGVHYMFPASSYILEARYPIGASSKASEVQVAPDGTSISLVGKSAKKDIVRRKLFYGTASAGGTDAILTFKLDAQHHVTPPPPTIPVVQVYGADYYSTWQAIHTVPVDHRTRSFDYTPAGSIIYRADSYYYGAPSVLRRWVPGIQAADVFTGYLGEVRRGANGHMYAPVHKPELMAPPPPGSGLVGPTGPLPLNALLQLEQPDISTGLPTATYLPLPFKRASAHMRLQPHRIYPLRTPNTRLLGMRQYELTDHLGNVRTLISDRKLSDASTYPLITDYRAQVLAHSNYYPFGAEMPGRNFSSAGYRFGYNTQERVDEISGSGNHYTAPFWEYDPRTGRRWNVDPVTYPWQSSYAVNNNNPIIFSDPLGLFGSRKEAREYRKEHNLKGRIRIDNEGYYSIDNKKAGTSTYKDAESGKVETAALVTAERLDHKTVTPTQLGVEWLTGGPKSRDFTSGDYTVELYKQHEHYQNAMSDVTDKLKNLSPNSSLPDYGYPYQLKGIEGVGKYIKDYSALATGGQTGNLMFTYLGSHSLWIEVTANDVERRVATVTFTVHNTSTLESGTRPPVLGYQEWYGNTIGNFLNTKVAGRTGATSETEQVFQWTETIKY